MKVIWNTGRNMYNKTVWYIRTIEQTYDDQTVTALYSQGGRLISTNVK